MRTIRGDLRIASIPSHKEPGVEAIYAIHRHQLYFVLYSALILDLKQLTMMAYIFNISYVDFSETF